MLLHRSPSSLDCNAQKVRLLGWRDTKCHSYHEDRVVLAPATINAMEKANRNKFLQHPQRSVGGDRDYSVKEWNTSQKGNKKTKINMKLRDDFCKKKKITSFVKVRQ